MDRVAETLAQEIVDSLSRKDRLLIGIAGVPASGKSTLAHLIVHHTNRLRASDTTAVHVGLDGWQLTRAQLDQFPDPKLAHDRRGSYWTFDASGYLAFVQSVRDGQEVVAAPSFDHHLGDPVFDAIQVHPYHKVVVIDGLYTLLDIPPWKEAGMLLDERWLIDIPPDKARARLIKRHVQTGVGKDEEQAIWRADTNDTPNGQFLLDHLLPPTKIIPSLEDPTL